MKPTDPDPGVDLPEDDEAAFERLERIGAWVDGELSGQERAAFERDLAADPELQAEVESFKQTMNAVANLGGPVQAPESFVAEVESRIRVRSHGRFFNDDFFYRSRVPYEVFAGLMLAMIAALLWFGESHQRDTDLAMAGSQQGKQAPAPRGGGDLTPPTPPTPPPTPHVAPLRRELVVYHLSLSDADPTARARALSQRFQATDQRYAVKVDADAERATLRVTMPRDQIESFVQSVSAEGQLRKTRAWIEGEAPETQTVTIVIDRSAPAPPIP